MADLKQIPDYVPGHNLLAGKNVVITAAAGTGIGYAAAKRALEEGANVLISDIHEGRLSDAVERLTDETGTKPHMALCNVTQQEDVYSLFAAASAAFDKIDIIINNAGLGGTADLVDMKDEEWAIVLDVTLNGCFRINRAAMQHMKENGGGVIVNNASVLGWRAQKGNRIMLRQRLALWPSPVVRHLKAQSLAFGSMRLRPRWPCTLSYTKSHQRIAS